MRLRISGPAKNRCGTIRRGQEIHSDGALELGKGVWGRMVGVWNGELSFSRKKLRGGKLESVRMTSGCLFGKQPKNIQTGLFSMFYWLAEETVRGLSADQAFGAGVCMMLLAALVVLEVDQRISGVSSEKKR